MKTERIVIQKISECIAALGGKSDIIGTINSWKDSLNDEEVIDGLNTWLEAQPSVSTSDTVSHTA